MGTLFIVSTPIGNLADISARAADVLEKATLVACEDTRRTGRLMQHLGLKQRLVSLWEHNEQRRTEEILNVLARDEDVALVSDAGTPLLSDPGFHLVRSAIAANHRVEAVPGPSAVLAALVSSGLPPYPFTFTGFPPRKSGKRRTFLRQFASHGHTLVIYESPHRIVATLDDALAELGDRPACIARELTKVHEEILRAPLSELHRELASRRTIKGEIVLVVGGQVATVDSSI